MTIFEQIQEVLKEKKGSQVTSTEIKEELNAKYGTKKSSILLSDYCYNRTNTGIKFKKETRIFEYIERNTYKYLGVGYPYTGKIIQKPIGGKAEIIVSEWINGNSDFPG